MRILYHHRTLADGAEGVHIAEMVSAFRALGHEVRVLGLAASGTARPGLIGGVRRLLPAAAYELASAGCNPAEYLTVQREAARFRPDFVYKRHARNDVGALAAARALAIPSVLEVNCLFSDPEYRRFEPLAFPAITTRLERRALSLASWIVAVSSPLASQVERLGAAGVTVLPNGANPVAFDPQRTDRCGIRSRLGLGDRFTVGWAGILRDWHGLELLLDAISAVPEARLLIVGDGPARPSLEARLRALELTARTTLAGRVPHAAMAEYIAAMDVAVVAEDRTRVASPMKLLEYMAMARAVVAPALDNVRDLVQDGIDGLLFTPGDSGALGAALGRLSSDAALRRRLGANARRTVQETRNWAHNAQTVIGLVRGARMPTAALRA
jgi:glycosyltransferase involved in cell wall biosynthesis